MCTHRRSTMHGSPSLILSALLLQCRFCSYGNGCSAHCTSRFGCRWSTQTWSAWSRHPFWRSTMCACSFHGPRGRCSVRLFSESQATTTSRRFSPETPQGPGKLQGGRGTILHSCPKLADQVLGCGAAAVRRRRAVSTATA